MAEQVQAQAGGLMKIGTVAAHNIAALLGLDPARVPEIEQAIKDEINAMSSHFTLAIADVQTQYEVEVAKIKSTYDWVNENKAKVCVAVAAAFAIGAFVGVVLGHLV